MDYFAARNRCKKCGILNHLFVDLKDRDSTPLADHEIRVNYKIESEKVNGKWIKQFTFGYSCPWCSYYNKHDTVYLGVGSK